jgi:membrane-associated phospholipid phosphatase
VWVASKGLPVTRTAVVLWILSGLFVLSLHNLQRFVTSFALEWFPFVAFLFVYDIVRTLADDLMPTHVRIVVDGERLLFGGHVPTLWLQHHLWHGADDLRWYDYASWAVYMTFFVATLVTAAGLWLYAYHRFRRYVAMVVTLAAAGFATYLLFPAAPPWYASAHGQLGDAPRLTAAIWSESGGGKGLSAVVGGGQGWANDVAAMPSLHAAFTLLITLFLWRSARWWWRIPLAAYPVAMGFALVYFSEHYVIDILAGWIYAAVIFVGVGFVADRRAPRLGDT